MSHLPALPIQSLPIQSLPTQSLHPQRRAASLSSSSCFMLLSAALGAACGDAPLGFEPATDVNPAMGWNPPALRGSVTLSDTELALDALTVLGSADVGSDGRCSSCHVLGRPTLTRWSTLTDAFSQDCL